MAPISYTSMAPPYPRVDMPTAVTWVETPRISLGLHFICNADGNYTTQKYKNL